MLQVHCFVCQLDFMVLGSFFFLIFYWITVEAYSYAFLLLLFHFNLRNDVVNACLYEAGITLTHYWELKPLYYYFENIYQHSLELIFHFPISIK